MAKLPDLEGLAVFAKVAERRSFAGAAQELSLSKATVSKAVSRVEAKLGTRLFNRTSRRLALTEAGRSLVARAAHILAEGEMAEAEGLAQSVAPRGLIRLAAPMSFGLLHLAPLLPDFFAIYPHISIDLHLSDAMVDVIGDGFDAALRIAALPDSSLLARRLCDTPRFLIASPAYLERHGRPDHPLELEKHACLGYLLTPDLWRFTDGNGESVSVRPNGPLRVNNGDAMVPALLAGLGLAVLPEFIIAEPLRDGRLEKLLPSWTLPSGALHWVTPPGNPRPARLTALADFLAQRLSHQKPQNA